MQSVKFVNRKSNQFWLGYIKGYPKYWTQGKTLEDLHEHLLDLYHELKDPESYLKNPN